MDYLSRSEGIKEVELVRLGSRAVESVEQGRINCNGAWITQRRRRRWNRSKLYGDPVRGH